MVFVQMYHNRVAEGCFFPLSVSFFKSGGTVCRNFS